MLTEDSLDGGVQVDMLINGKFLCSSDAVYGTKTEADFESGGMGGHNHGGGSAGSTSGKGSDGTVSKIKTISAMTSCDKSISVKKGDTMVLIAEYDLSKHPLRKTANGGQAADVMGMMAVEFTAAKQ